MKNKITSYFCIQDITDNSRRREYVDARRLYSYYLQQHGARINSIAQELGVSESRACRYVQEATELIYAKHSNIIKIAYYNLF